MFCTGVSRLVHSLGAEPEELVSWGILTGNGHDVRKREEHNRKDEPGHRDHVDRHTNRIPHEEWAAVHGFASQQDICAYRHNVRDIVDGDGRA